MKLCKAPSCKTPAVPHRRLCEKHRVMMNLSSQKSKLGVKREVITHYGSRCACCRESNLIFLNIDHINRNGSEHRASLGPKGKGGIHFHYWLRANLYPKGFRVLCFNCNFAIYHQGVCPHTRRLK